MAETSSQPQTAPPGIVLEASTSLALSSRALYRFLVESITEYAIFAIARDGAVVTWDVGPESIFGYTRDEIIGKKYDVILTPEDRRAGEPEFEIRSAANTGKVSRDAWHVRKDGSRFWGTNTVEPILDAAGTLVGFTKIVRDATERYRATEALRLSEERFRLLVESVRDYALFSVSPDGRITLWNRGAELLYGYRGGEIIGKPYATLYTREDAEAGVPEAELAHAAMVGFAVDERWHPRKDGSRFFATGRLTRVAPAAEDREPRGFVKVAHDMTERKALEDLMRHQALHDQLTGLPNRAMFLEHLRRTLAHSKRHRTGFALFFIDVDGFKLVNDSVGHVVADELLRELASQLRKLVREEDVVARLGGDEFALLATDVDSAREAERLAERLHAALDVPLSGGGKQVKMTVSIGIALDSDDYRKPEDALRDADTAMYAAKALGRSKHSVFTRAMHGRMVARQSLEADLHRAVERCEFRIVYQPVVDLETSRVAGFEALVRWHHPTRGLLLPKEFIELATNAGVVIALDRWVLRNACREVANWAKRSGGSRRPTLGVNLSASHFAHDGLVAYIDEVLRETGFAGSELKLEITEDTIMDRSGSVIDTMLRLRESNVQTYIDDFGTGYSSLSYLADLPVAMLKIDLSFVRQMIERPSSARIVETIVKLGHDLDLQTTAEGIETREQRDALRLLGCEFGQGYLFSKPLDWAAASAWSATGT